MDLAEFFTALARDAVPLAWRKGLLFLFDYRGPFVHVDAPEQAMRSGLDRLSQAALELLEDGFVFFAAQTDWNEAGSVDVAISIAGTGHRASNDQLSVVLGRLGLAERQRAGVPEGTRVASGPCPFTGATISLAANRTEGVLLAFDLTLPGSPIMGDSQADAAGARAWLLSERPGMYQSLVRRLQRLGWATTTFASPLLALDQLRAMSPGMARPSLVVAAESSQITAVSLQALRYALPQRTQVILAGAHNGATPVDEGIEQRQWPFSPTELLRITQHARNAAERGSGETMPAPLTFIDRPRALVVDDNQVNVLVATGLLQLAGFEVRSASSGEAAIVQCRAEAPHLVLMDVHMPGLDGLQTTRTLRRMQSDGLLPHFVVIGASADAIELGEAACREAGMDGYISKPLSLPAIQMEVQRLLPGCRPASLASGKALG
jgi:CheY-like chemotaxis protein